MVRSAAHMIKQTWWPSTNIGHNFLILNGLSSNLDTTETVWYVLSIEYSTVGEGTRYTGYL